ncbi:rho GTPase activator [Pseudovirgaria hyperparasitica]|uniref:Rho GTPase activator n=1 Tax=Pseudovirgaria hyperparasitica TaxID=470096 RepID=A0A6A6VWV0_9PEZI|nr:rho GTPase activator [Pseudovirgaria hyperparasitica]KAF2754120.1 rho GTPase activator [Pseudovirgaria hyperparasitica]
MDQRPRPSQDNVSRELVPTRQSESQDRQGRVSEQPSSSIPRDRSQKSANRRPSGSRICGKCSQNLTGQFVRALGDTYHLECFTCHDCDKIVASKFFPVPDSGPNQYPLCEVDYFKRLDLLCYACGGALRGSYITALDRKYHIEHFTCSVCPTVFGAADSYYEHEGNVYCHFHYSTRFAQRCNGCQTSILKQFVEIFRNGQNQHWHPECYMIHKYWNVRLASSNQAVIEPETDDDKASDEVREAVRKSEEKVEEKVLWIWRTLSAFEEKSATCISDMLLHVSNGAYMEGVMAAKKFIVHIDLLFGAADNLDQLLVAHTPKGLSYSREAKLLCKKVVAFFQLLAESSQTSGVRRLGVTQELLSLVTGLAHYLKLLIRICLQGSLRLERETGNQEGLGSFLNDINALEPKIEKDAEADANTESALYTPRSADTCPVCEKSVEDRCFKNGHLVFHTGCMVCQNCGNDMTENISDARWTSSRQRVLCSECSRIAPDADGGFVTVSKLRQYVHLLRVAHARLLANLRTNGALPHTSDDPNLADYDSNKGHRLSDGEDAPGLLRSNTRSKSYGGSSGNDGQQNSYEQTLGDIRRLRSQRLDKHLSSTMKRARSSRIIDGPDGLMGRSDDAYGDSMTGQGMHYTQDKDANGEGSGALNLGGNALALDDIPRLVAAEQARDQRPNASKYARGNLVGSEPKARLINGHRRDFSGGQELEMAAAGEPMTRPKKYFSELSALEYFIVRHIAVLSMEPLLEGKFNQEELLDLIETKRNNFWAKFGKAFKPDSKQKGPTKKKGIFGRALEHTVEIDGAESTDGVGFGTLKIPALVQDSISAMRSMDMSVEGVFRKNGNIRRLKELAEQIDRDGGDTVDLTKENPVQVAALLKKFLRELPDPILTFKLYKLFIVGAQLQDEDSRRRVLHLTCCLLPKVHRDCMEVLFSFLNWASSFSTVDEETGSKMDIHNLATVVAPNILYSNTKGMEMDTSFLAIEVVHTLIECNESMCEVPEDIVSMLSDSTLFEISPDLTTKEILKRWGEIGRVPQATITNTQTQRPRSREGKQANGAAVARIDTVPPQWQNESSVRHVGGNQHMTYGPSSAQNTPPQHQHELATPNLPYAHGHSNGSSESRGGSPHRQPYRSSPGMQKQNPMGITGAG